MTVRMMMIMMDLLLINTVQRRYTFDALYLHSGTQKNPKKPPIKKSTCNVPGTDQFFVVVVVSFLFLILFLGRNQIIHRENPMERERERERGEKRDGSILGNQTTPPFKGGSFLGRVLIILPPSLFLST